MQKRRPLLIRSLLRGRRLSVLITVVFATLWLAACAPSADAPADDAPVADAPPADAATERAAPPANLPADLHDGFTAFTTFCSECHGEGAMGTDQGPPLVHIYYEPSHHGDNSFVSAASMGVPQHHWDFGDMPPVEGISDPEVFSVIDYVRHLQREVGIH